MKYNKSKTYLLPLLSELITLDKKFIPYLKNTYIFDDKGIYKNCIYILHEFNFKDPKYTIYEHNLINNELFIDYYDIGGEVLYIFKFPEAYLKEYNYLLKGQYSKFGQDSKELILNFWNFIYENNIQAVTFLKKIKQILFKDIYLKQEMEVKLSSINSKVLIDKNAELGSIINIQDETFNLSEIMKEINENNGRKYKKRNV